MSRYDDCIALLKDLRIRYWSLWGDGDTKGLVQRRRVSVLEEACQGQWSSWGVRLVKEVLTKERAVSVVRLSSSLLLNHIWIKRVKIHPAIGLHFLKKKKKRFTEKVRCSGKISSFYYLIQIQMKGCKAPWNVKWRVSNLLFPKSVHLIHHVDSDYKLPFPTLSYMGSSWYDDAFLWTSF